MTPTTPTPNKQTFSVSLDFRLVSLALFIVICVLVGLWRPWQDRVPANARTISVTGQTTLEAKPDEYIFYPSYEIKDASKSAALAKITQKSETVTQALKKLGVADSKIKTSTGGYAPYYEYDSTKSEYTYTLQITITVGAYELAQKVQDYLVTTEPTGSVSPQAGFSKTKQKSLEQTARDAATKDARSKADQMAKNLGFSVSAVKSVSDGGTLGGIMPFAATERAIAADTATASRSSLTIQPGENELPYSVNVTYYIK